MSMLVAKSRVQHDGQVFEEGDLIEGLSDSQAQALVDAGVVTKVNDRKQAEKLAPQEEDLTNRSRVLEDETSAKTSENEKTEDNAMDGVKPDSSWTKVRLLGYARAKGLNVTDEMTRAELFNAISEADSASEETETNENSDDTTAPVGPNNPPESETTPSADEAENK